MKRIILIVIIIIGVALVILNKSGNSSSSELVLDRARAQELINEINDSFDIIGSKRFYNMYIDDDKFKGEIEQPASYFNAPLTKYKITDKISIDFGNSNITVSDSGSGKTKMWDASLPTGSEPLENTGIPEASILGVGEKITGIRPIMKNDKQASEWTAYFMFDSPYGMKLNNMTEYHDEIWSKMSEVNNAAHLEARIKFLEWVFGKPSSTTGDELEWDEFKVDRLVAMTELNVQALTGIEKNKRALQLIDPNRVTVYEVTHVNTTSFTKLINTIPEPVKSVLSDTAKQNKFISDLANHLNQVLGGKRVIIPHRDTFIIRNEDKPFFIMN